MRVNVRARQQGALPGSRTCVRHAALVLATIATAFSAMASSWEPACAANACSSSPLAFARLPHAQLAGFGVSSGSGHTPLRQNEAGG